MNFNCFSIMSFTEKRNKFGGLTAALRRHHDSPSQPSPSTELKEHSQTASPTINIDEWVYVPEEDRKMSGEDLQQQTWIDDIPVDNKNSGVGFSVNQIYKADGYRHEDHEFEDRCFRFKLSETCYLYGIFDGHCGSKAAEFISQRIAAEMVLDQQIEKQLSEPQICQLLYQAFATAEAAYFASLDSLIAERTSIQQELHNQIREDCVRRLRQVDKRLESGTSALVVLIKDRKIYIANVGNSRALMCRTDADGALIIDKLNTDHTLQNELEVQRLVNLGVPSEKLKDASRFGNQLYTRCLGDYSVKGGYKDSEQMNMATSEPVISEPEIKTDLIKDDCRFLLLMSDGAYRSLEEACPTLDVNVDLARMVCKEFENTSTLSGVAHAVLDHITRLHRDEFQNSNDDSMSMSQTVNTRDDMTLLVINFNYPLRARPPRTPERAASNPALTTRSGSRSLLTPTPSDTNPLIPDLSLSNIPPIIDYSLPSRPDTAMSPPHNMPTPPPSPPKTSTLAQSGFFTTLSGTGGSILDTLDEESLVDTLNSVTTSITRSLERDSDGRIKPYVDFSPFHKKLASMSEKERHAFLQELKPKLDCETIEELPEPDPSTA